MTARDRIERALKDLDTLTQLAKAGAIGAAKLDDKVEMQRTANDLSAARHLLRKRVFCIEDAQAYASNTRRCKDCLSVVASE